jgi:hypothetical protein
MTGDEMLEELGVDENGSLGADEGDFAVEIEVEIGGRTVKLVPVSPVRFEHNEKRIVIPAEVAS